MKRKTYNDYNADWFRAHPHLMHMRELAGIEDDDEARQYAAEQSPPEPEDEIHDYRDRRGK
jgi:hypothetical protein